MIIVVTGLVGVDKKPYLAEVCRLAKGVGHDIFLCNVGQMMYAEAPDIENSGYFAQRLHPLIAV